MDLSLSEEQEMLRKMARDFFQKEYPKDMIREMEEENDTTKTISCGSNLAVGILCVFLGCLSVYGLLFATGYWIYSNYVPAVALTAVTIVTTVLLIALWSKLKME